MASQRFEHAVAAIKSIVPKIRDHRILAASTALIAVGLVPVLSRAAESYRGYLALGPGGVPYNIFGWMFQGLAGLIARPDTRSPEPFADPGARTRDKYGPDGQQSFLPAGFALPARPGARPDVPGYTVPQRQMSQRGERNAEVRRRLCGFLVDLARANPGVLATAPSGLEMRGTPGLFYRPEGSGYAAPWWAARTKGEFAHVHPEASTHVILSLADAEEAARKGWVERHRLSGVIFPLTYVMVYAPRDEDELEVVKALIIASVGFVSAGGPKAQTAV